MASSGPRPNQPWPTAPSLIVHERRAATPCVRLDRGELAENTTVNVEPSRTPAPWPEIIRMPTRKLKIYPLRRGSGLAIFDTTTVASRRRPPRSEACPRLKGLFLRRCAAGSYSSGKCNIMSTKTKLYVPEWRDNPILARCIEPGRGFLDRRETARPGGRARPRYILEWARISETFRHSQVGPFDQACLASMTFRRTARVFSNRRSRISPSPHRMARCRAVKSSVKRPRTSKTASLLLRKASRHTPGRRPRSVRNLEAGGGKPHHFPAQVIFRSVAVPTMVKAIRCGR